MIPESARTYRRNAFIPKGQSPKVVHINQLIKKKKAQIEQIESEIAVIKISLNREYKRNGDKK